DIDDAGFERVADLERRHGFRSADIVDLKDALAVPIHALDEALEAARIGGVFGKGRNRAQGDVLGRRRGCPEDGHQAHDQCPAHDCPLCNDWKGCWRYIVSNIIAVAWG